MDNSGINMNNKDIQCTESKIRKIKRALSIHRFSQKFHISVENSPANPTNPVSSPSNEAVDDEKDRKNISNRKIFRRSSFKKFMNRIAQIINTNHSKADKKVPQTNSSNYVWPKDTIPGVIGLRNHGNTCFMNAVLQCLSHTDLLAEYFVLDQYKADLKRRNKINAKKFGTKGELTEQLALVLKALWTNKDANEYSSSFKAVVDRYGSQFRSSTQHDAQEFLFWLLDKVHEDLNTATKRKYKIIKNNGRSDEVIAAETLANHMRCNNSFVQAVFQAQFRSSLTCPRCHKQSNTFDPFHCISVQLPQLTQQGVFAKVIYATQQPKQVQLGIRVPHGSSIMVLREQLQIDTRIPANRIILTEITEAGFNRVLCDSQTMLTITETDPIYCIEVPEPIDESTQLTLCLVNVKKCDKSDKMETFGTPFCLHVNRDISYVELQKRLLKEMSSILKAETFAYTTPITQMFKLKLQDPSCDPDTYLEPNVEHPLFTEIIDMALSILPTDAGPSHIKLHIEWLEPEKFFANMSDTFVEHESVTKLKENMPNETALTLEQCLEHYTRAETLSAEDAWRCPQCREYLPVVKTLGLWSLPDILVIHFKRFRQQQLKGPQAAKLTTMVDFPLNAFDMSPHLARECNGTTANGFVNSSAPPNGNGLHDDNWSPWRKTTKRGLTQGSQFYADNRYDLYAVCYHQGDTLETGHYTAACRNPFDHNWYKFDDQKVTKVDNEQINEEIVNNEAYILFYQRRKSDGSECSGQTSGSSSSSSNDHWVSKMAVPPLPLSETEVEKSTTPTESEKHSSSEILIEDVNKIVKIEEIINKEENPIVEEKQVLEEQPAVEVQDQNDQINEKSEKVVEVDVVIEAKIEEVKLKDESKDEIVVPKLNGVIENQKMEKKMVKDLEKKIENEMEKEIKKEMEMKKEKEIKKEMEKKEEKVTVKEEVKEKEEIEHNITLFEKDRLDAVWEENLTEILSNQSNRFQPLQAATQMIRAGSCSKDTLMYIDHSFIDDDEDDLLGSTCALWISPVAPHKLITVSPKN